MDDHFFWNTFMPDVEPNERYFQDVSRWANFSKSERYALAGCLRTVVMLHPQHVARLTPEMQMTLFNLFTELEDEVRS